MPVSDFLLTVYYRYNVVMQEEAARALVTLSNWCACSLEVILLNFLQLRETLSG